MAQQVIRFWWRPEFYCRLDSLSLRYIAHIGAGLSCIYSLLIILTLNTNSFWGSF